jgi:methylmalonyl-CoA mutase C-terminal domain/subunit
LGVLKKLGASDIRVMAGGLILPKDVEQLVKMGVSGNYGPGTPPEVIIQHVRKLAGM